MEIQEHFPNKPILNFVVSSVLLYLGNTLDQATLHNVAGGITWCCKNLAYLGAGTAFIKFVIQTIVFIGKKKDNIEKNP